MNAPRLREKSLLADFKTRAGKFRKLLLLGLAVWFACIPIHSWLTARERVYQHLDDELWNLCQQSIEKRPLPETERQACLRQLRSPDETKRWAAAAKLASWGDASAAAALVAAMRDDRGTRRTCVIAQSLGRIGSAEAVPALLEAIQHPRNRDLRLCATEALAKIGDERALESLLSKARDRDRQDDYVSAIVALGELGLAQALPALRDIVATDPSSRYRGLAAASIRQIEIVQAADPVAELLFLLDHPQAWISDGWVLRELAKRWDARVAQALNRYVMRSDLGPDRCVQAAALLLHHRAIDAATAQQLAHSNKRLHRLLAEYVETRIATPASTAGRSIASL